MQAHTPPSTLSSHLPAALSLCSPDQELLMPAVLLAYLGLPLAPQQQQQQQAEALPPQHPPGSEGPHSGYPAISLHLSPGSISGSSVDPSTLHVSCSGLYALASLTQWQATMQGLTRLATATQQQQQQDVPVTGRPV